MRGAGERAWAPYQKHSSTSKAAADAILPKLGALHQRVYRYLRQVGGATDEEGSTGLGMNPSTYRPRRIELAAHGYIRESKRPGLTKAGRTATIWEVTEKGRPS